MSRLSQSLLTASILACVAAYGVIGSTAIADERTWIGEITDNMCSKHHESFEENKPVLPAPECTMACIRGGSKFVLRLEDGAVLKIANQDLKALTELAGLKVKLTGEMKDDAVTASKVERVDK